MGRQAPYKVRIEVKLPDGSTVPWETLSPETQAALSARWTERMQRALCESYGRDEEGRAAFARL